MHNKSQPVVTFTDYDENSAPYEGRALRVRLVDDVLFVYVGTLTEGTVKDVGTETFKADDAHSIGIDAEGFYEALGLMLRAKDREQVARMREANITGDPPSNLTTRPEVVHVPVIRTRA